MARDGNSWAVKTIFTTAGPKSGKTSSEFHFIWDTVSNGQPLNTDLANLHTSVQHFWNGTAGGATTVGYYMGPQVYRGSNGTEIASYNLDLLADGPPANHYGSPVNITNFTLGAAATSNPLPNECAATLSYRADYGTDPEHGLRTRPRADDRGRIYIGPLCDAATSTASIPNGTSYAILYATFVTRCLTQLSGLRTEAAGFRWTLAVWSRKRHQLKPAIDKAMDNNYDTMRKREVVNPLQTWQPL